MANNNTATDDRLHIYARSGIVVSKDNWSRTHVDGVVSGNTGHITSSTTDVAQMFVQQEDGREFDVTINELSVPVRQGNYVSVVYARSQGSKRDVGVAFVNHATERSQIFENRIGPLLGVAFVDLNGCLVVIAAIALVMVFGSQLGLLRDPLLMLCVLAIPVVLIFSSARTKSKRNALRARYVAEISNFIRDLIQSEKAPTRPD